MALVNFSIPTIPSFKSTTPDSTPKLFVPDIKYLVKFAEGDLGIADSIMTNMILKNIGKMDNIEQLKIFTKATGSSLSQQPENYIKDGKVKISESDIKLGKSDTNLGGLHALEKSLFQSIFETQKPYMEIVKIVAESMVKIEDIAARALAVGGSSMRPSNNPKALGYKDQGDNSLSSGLYKLGNLSKTGLSSNKPKSNDTSSKESTSTNDGYIAITQSIVYSTGNFIPSVNYTYIYKDIIDDSIKLDDGELSIDVPEIDDSGRPQVIVMGIYDSNWNKLSDNFINDNLNWLIRSGKWFGYLQQVTPSDSKQSTLIEFKKYYMEYASSRCDKKGLSQEEKVSVLEHVSKSLSDDSINKQIDNMSKYSFLPFSTKYTDGIDDISNNKYDAVGSIKSGFKNINYPYKPSKLSVNNEDIWVDAEGLYDMKIIKCVPSKDINRFKKTADSDIIIEKLILNEQLANNKPYDTGLYGSPLVNNASDDGTPTDVTNQTIGEMYRFVSNKDDNETYYIIEGILSSNNPQSNGGTNGSDGSSDSGGGRDYRIKDSLGVISVFADFLIDIGSKLIPQIISLIKTIKNPPQFITEIIKSKMGDGMGTEAPKFGFFSKDFLDSLSKLSTMNDADKAEFVNSSSLKNYLYISNIGEAKFLLDGSATIKLFGDAPIFNGIPSVEFGLETKIGSLATNDPQIPIKLIFKLNKNKSDEENSNDIENMSSEELKNQIENSSLTNGSIPNKLIVNDSGSYQLADISVKYSTGVYMKDVNYTYIYVTEYVNNLIKESDELESQGKYQKAMDKLTDASKEDPKNTFIKEKIKSLSSRLDAIGIHGTQPILDFLINLVSLPLKVVFGIISKIKEFFESLTNPFELATKVVEFVTFKWIADFFNPTNKNSMFAMSGLLFDIPTFINVWIPSLKSNTKDSFDMNDIIKLPWTKSLPTYTKEDFQSLIYGINGRKSPNMQPISMLNSILVLIEKIINAFIDFIWALFGLASLIDPPYIKLSRNASTDLSAKDIMDLLNGKYFDTVTNSSGGTNSNYNFIYNIKTSDGRDVRDLDEEELQLWIDENKDLEFIFNL